MDAGIHFYFYFSLSVETTRTTVNSPGQRDGPPSPPLLDPRSYDRTEESGHQLVSDNVSSVTIGSRVSTMEASLNNQGRQKQVIEDLLKQLVGSGMASPPPMAVILPVPPKRGSDA